MPDVIPDEVDLFGLDIKTADALSHSSLVFRYARAMAAGRALWASRRELQDRVAELEYQCRQLDIWGSHGAWLHSQRTKERNEARARVAELEGERDLLKEQGAKLNRDYQDLLAQLKVAEARIAGHRDGAAASQRAILDMHADLTAARERVAELEAQLAGGAR